MTPSTTTLVIFLVALALFVADFLPMGLLVFSVPMALYFAGIIEAKEIFALSMALLPILYPFFR